VEFLADIKFLVEFCSEIVIGLFVLKHVDLIELLFSFLEESIELKRGL
jgi:hypothetical protein